MGLQGQIAKRRWERRLVTDRPRTRTAMLQQGQRQGILLLLLRNRKLAVPSLTLARHHLEHHQPNQDVVTPTTSKGLART